MPVDSTELRDRSIPQRDMNSELCFAAPSTLRGCALLRVELRERLALFG
jgi:hypothetical protein